LKKIKSEIKVHLEELLNEPIEDNPNEYPQLQANLLRNGEITMEEAIDDVFGLIFAGHDTSSHAFTTCVYYLGKNP
jgi:cytochrome P450